MQIADRMNESLKVRCSALVAAACLLWGSESLASPLSSELQAEFQAHYQHGERLYLARRYSEAISRFQRALSIQSDSNVIYNIAQCHKKLEHHREAKEYFEWFLRIPTDISAEERQQLKKTIAELDENIRRADEVKVIVVNAEQPRRPAWRIGLGIASIAAGVTLAGLGGAFLSIDGQAVLTNGKEDFTRVYDTKALATGLIVPGAVVFLGGVILLALPGDKPKPVNNAQSVRTLALRLGSVGTGTGLSVHGTW